MIFWESDRKSSGKLKSDRKWDEKPFEDSAVFKNGQERLQIAFPKRKAEKQHRMDSEKGTEEKVHCKCNENLICETEDSKAGVLKK